MAASRILYYADSVTRVGRVLVVMSDSGVVDVVPVGGGPAGRIVRSLRSRFPGAHLVPDRGIHGAWAAAAIAHIEGARPVLVAPLDLRCPDSLPDKQASGVPAH